jgi:tRNA threonylcarbamoyladenosine biosynthesis protein TsaE
MQALAAALAERLHGGDVVALSGGLGAGKTTFVRGIVRSLLGDDPVSSPTFTFRHRYEGPGLGFAVEHLDLYRLEDESELTELGLEEAFGPAILTVIEWPERAPSLVGLPAWRVAIVGSGDEPREVTIERSSRRNG